jgi:hypothetical protein
VVPTRRKARRVGQPRSSFDSHLIVPRGVIHYGAIRALTWVSSSDAPLPLLP